MVGVVPMGVPAKDQARVNGGTPPVTSTVAVPSHVVQCAGVLPTTRSGPSEPMTVQLCVMAQPLASCTVAVQTPGHRNWALSTPWPLGGTGSHTMVWAPVPPAVSKLMLPLHAPAQPAGVTSALMVSGSGAVTWPITRVMQPSASVMFKVYAPAHSPLAYGVPCPSPGAGVQARS